MAFARWTGHSLMNETRSPRWAEALKRFQTIEGMLALLEAGTMTAMLEWQNAAGIVGNMAEFGTFKGRSASLLAHYIRDREKLFLVDVADYLDVTAISSITTNFEFLKMDSAKFLGQRFGRRVQNDFRFVHADGSHTFDNVYNDLKTADALLSKSGIVVVDDYFNPHYPQVPAAIYHYLALARTDFAVALIGANKCYLCRKAFHPAMKQFIKGEFPRLMESFGLPIRLSKTDRHEKMDCFSFTGRPAGSEEKIYGAHLYGRFFSDQR